jgi:hypothetical protein
LIKQQKYQHILLAVLKLKRSITMQVCCQDGKHSLDLDIYSKPIKQINLEKPS